MGTRLHLYTAHRWEWAQADVQFSTARPPDGLVQSIHVIGFTSRAPAEIVCCREADGKPWFLPGGTREPAETIDACVRRELEEEAGARLTSPLTWLGAHFAVGYRDVPYRPYLPHPHKAWLWCAADVVLDRAPTNPPGAEQVEEVRSMPIHEAKALLSRSATWYVDLVDLALHS